MGDDNQFSKQHFNKFIFIKFHIFSIVTAIFSDNELRIKILFIVLIS